jgi:hypothetical protein
MWEVAPLEEAVEAELFLFVEFPGQPVLVLHGVQLPAVVQYTF